jgi:hypothetical protein
MPNRSTGKVKRNAQTVRPLSLAQVPRAVTRLSAPTGTDRYAAGKSLVATAEKLPGRVYPHFDALVPLLSGDNKIVRWIVIRLLSLLAPADTSNRLDRLLEQYLAPIQEATMITAANTLQGAARIVQAKPHLLPRILPAMLAVESATYETPECRNVAIAHTLDALKSLWPIVRNEPQVQAFIQRQTANSRVSAAKRARELLAR